MYLWKDLKYQCHGGTIVEWFGYRLVDFGHMWFGQPN